MFRCYFGEYVANIHSILEIPKTHQMPMQKRIATGRCLRNKCTAEPTFRVITNCVISGMLFISQLQRYKKISILVLFFPFIFEKSLEKGKICFPSPTHRVFFVTLRAVRSTAGKCQDDSRKESDGQQGRYRCLPTSQGRAVRFPRTGGPLPKDGRSASQGLAVYR